MKKRTRLAVASLALLLAMPLAAGAQEPPKKEAPKAAPAKPAAPPAARAAPAARSAPVARPAAPHPAPHPVVRAAPPRPAAPHPAARVTLPHPVQRAATPQRQAPAVDRAAQRRVQRAKPKAAATPAAKTAAPAASTRTQQRAERTQRRREDRALRNTPRSQRAAKREEIRRAREQRALGRQQTAQPKSATATPSAAVQTNAAAQTTAQTRAQRRAARRAALGVAAVTPQAARAGRFAARFANPATTRARRGHYAARRAWARGYRAAFVPWYGPVFWPYAYSDIFDYAFWPYGYDDGFWFFAYDDFVDSLFWGEEGPPEEYVDYAVPPPQPRYAAVQELCRQPGTGITAWPFAEIERKAGLNADQKNLLGDMRKAAKDAAAVFKASCPADNAFPLTPPGRLRAMTARLQATLEAVQAVRPALEAFYTSLSDEQMERFNQLGPKRAATNAEASAALPADAKACSEAKPGLTNLPIERIGDAVDPTEEQDALLARLQDATDKGVAILQAACPEQTPLTPPGRLEAMETRLKAMIEAANTVKPALDAFYASLSNEQKARFNRIKETMQAGG